MDGNQVPSGPEGCLGCHNALPQGEWCRACGRGEPKAVIESPYCVLGHTDKTDGCPGLCDHNGERTTTVTDAAKRTNRGPQGISAGYLRQLCNGCERPDNPARCEFCLAADTIESLQAEVERLTTPLYVCTHCGYHPDSSMSWCAAGCGRDFNKMIQVRPR